ncbi:molybdopterin-guanine dinucleotide biosynthesis protein B, partial [Sinorhizobium medicae]
MNEPLRPPKIFGIAGWKNSGKTGLMVRLVSEMTRRGYIVSTIKHAHHDFDIDKVGADSYRHREAGAHEVTIVSATRYAIMHELRGAPEPAFE